MLRHVRQKWVPIISVLCRGQFGQNGIICRGNHCSIFTIICTVTVTVTITVSVLIVVSVDIRMVGSGGFVGVGVGVVV